MHVSGLESGLRFLQSLGIFRKDSGEDAGTRISDVYVSGLESGLRFLQSLGIFRNGSGEDAGTRISHWELLK